MHLNDYLQRHAAPRSLERGSHLMRQGDAAPMCYLLRSGLLKAYYLDDAGREYIKSFFAEGALVGSLRATIEQMPSPFSVVALEHCQLLGVPLLAIREAASTDLQLANEVIGLLIDLALRKERREQEFLVLSPEENYRRLCAEAPGLLERLTQIDIARYLGITPVALSRIRGRIRSQP